MTLKAMQLTKFKRLLAKFYRARGLFCLLFIFTSPVHASGKFAPWPSDLGADIPAPWQAQYHPKIAAHTEFKLIKQGKKTLLQADANMAYGTLVHPFPMPTELKKLHWEWQVLIHPSNANLQTKAGDDAGAKLCVFVQIDEAKLGLGTRLALATARTISGVSLPAATLCYVWGVLGEKTGQVFDNPYTDRVKFIVVRASSSPSELLTEQRDVQADARKAFGKELPEGAVLFTGIALGADSDNTQSKASALFGEISAH